MSSVLPKMSVHICRVCSRSMGPRSFRTKESSFDGAYVTVAVGNLRLRFVRGRGDLSVKVASAFAPNDWEDFQLVADGVGRWDTSKPGPRYYTLETFEPVLRSRLQRLQEGLSKDRFETTLNNAAKIYNDSVQEYAATLRQSGVIPKLY